jgi:hypothetical protein
VGVSIPQPEPRLALAAGIPGSRTCTRTRACSGMRASSDGGCGRGGAEPVHHVHHAVDVPDQPDGDRDKVTLVFRQRLARQSHDATVHGYGDALRLGEQNLAQQLTDLLGDQRVRRRNTRSRSRRLTMPISLPSGSTTGSRLMWRSCSTRAARGMGASG